MSPSSHIQYHTGDIWNLALAGQPYLSCIYIPMRFNRIITAISIKGCCWLGWEVVGLPIRRFRVRVCAPPHYLWHFIFFLSKLYFWYGLWYHRFVVDFKQRLYTLVTLLYHRSNLCYHSSNHSQYHLISYVWYKPWYKSLDYDIIVHIISMIS